MFRTVLAFLAGLALAAGAGQDPPALLSRTGLYVPGRVGEVARANMAYSPQYPLWTDGAAKRRWIRLPEGATIDVRNVDAWNFPVGTRFWKEFAFAGRKVETRMLWRITADRWGYAAYHWRHDQSDADLVPSTGLGWVAELPEGLAHSIPSLADCKACHENGATPVLGFTALQLSTDRDPLAPHAEPLAPGMATLRTLAERRLLAPARPELLSAPPRIQASTPRARAALGYLAANCGACHTPENPIRGVELVLAHSAAGNPAPATTIGRPSHFQIPGQKATSLVCPGDPDRSALLHRMKSMRPETRMPPMGTVLPDWEAVALVRDWIAEETR